MITANDLKNIDAFLCDLQSISLPGRDNKHNKKLIRRLRHTISEELSKIQIKVKK